MTHSARTGLSLACALAAASPALAQHTVDPAHKFSWQENCGFMNWGANIGGPGQVLVHDSFLSGFVWCENIGWINLGDGAPANAVEYQNNDGTDFGANFDPGSGEMYGLAWGENVGWINFRGGAGATPDRTAFVDIASLRLRGFAWGENIGWINLDDATVFVGLRPDCAADFNGADGVTVQDIYDFLAAWNSGLSTADFNGADGVTVQDIYDFLAAWNAGCA